MRRTSPSSSSDGQPTPSFPHQIFSISNIRRAWKKAVREGLRNQVLLDLHDYLDIHRNQIGISTKIRSDILEGFYRPREPEIVTLEKKLGITRFLAIPSPRDAIVLQTIADALEKIARNKQQSSKAFYSRSHDRPTRPSDFTGNFGYPWWILWPQFQKEIWNFHEPSKFIVVTDIANYFDSIRLDLLRNSIASLSGFEEPLLDFLFYMLEAFGWRPTYIPASGVGLPLLEFDAPRLLAHIFLFKVDKFLDGETEGRFVRWMDDITFQADSQGQAKRLLGKLDEQLRLGGIRLNTGKTQILCAQQGYQYFRVADNIDLNIIQSTLSWYSSHSQRVKTRAKELTRSRFERFYNGDRSGHWEKVLRRFFTIFARLQDDYLEKTAEDLLFEQPSLRRNIQRYFLALGYTPDRLELIKDFTSSDQCTDDASLFAMTKLLVEWRIPRYSNRRRELVSLAREIAGNKRSMPGVIAGLWLMAKYGSSTELSKYTEEHSSTWTRSQWASRQFAAVGPRHTKAGRQMVRDLIIRNGLLDGLLVASHLEELAKVQHLDRQMLLYLRHKPKGHYNYPLQKVLIALAVLKGDLQIRQKSQLRMALADIVDDPVYAEILEISQLRLDLEAG